MNNASLTQYDIMPPAMIAYMSNYGPHFSRKLFEFATSRMYKTVNGRKQRISVMSKDELNSLLASNNIILERNQLYDAAYVVNMCRADFWGSSITDDRHLALYVKDVIDDIDAPDGLVFNRFYADCCYSGIAIDWEEML